MLKIIILVIMLFKSEKKEEKKTSERLTLIMPKYFIGLGCVLLLFQFAMSKLWNEKLYVIFGYN